MNDIKGDINYDAAARQAMIQGGFEPDFSPAAVEQIVAIKKRAEILPPNLVDLRNLLWTSIDNNSSRDLDQIEWAERLASGDIRLRIGIADVDWLVEKDSPIDRRAAQNTVTVYTPTKIFPMLPEELSTDLTSLNESADRVAVVIEMTVKPNGDVPDSRFYGALVRNKAKLAYDIVGRWLDGEIDVPDSVKNIAGLTEQIQIQNEAAKRLYAYRRAKGALEFESIESEPVFENGRPRKIISVLPNSARRLIENFMIAANVEMAEFLENSGSVSLRRVVKVPERWDGIRRIAEEYGESLPASPDQLALAAFLDKRRAADPASFPDLSLSIIKLIGSGSYVVQRKGEDAGGHFGLAVADYAHTTAPNRRFTDLVVQRLVKAVLDKKGDAYTDEEIEAIAANASEREKAARKVERKTRKIIAAGVMRERIGETFAAIVTGVTPSGTFARILRPPVDGRIVKGESGLQVGEKLTVRLIAADPRTGFIDFAKA